jgi:hypothetical protein
MLTLAENFPIETKFYRYEFVCEKSLVTHIAVSGWCRSIGRKALSISNAVELSS